MPVLIGQVAVCARLGTSEAKLVMSKCLDVMTETITEDALLKSTNLGLLMHTRSEDARLQIFALSCSEVLWRSHGGKLLGKSSDQVLLHHTELVLQGLLPRLQPSSLNVPRMRMIW